MIGSGRRVVLTGLGSVSPLGIGDGRAVTAALARGAARLGPVRGFPTDECASHLGGEAGDLGGFLAPEEVRRLPRVSQFAVIACRLATADAGVERGSIPDLGLVLGSHYGDLRSSEAFAAGFLARGPLGLSPLLFPSTVMNAIAAHAAIAVGARGPMLTVNEAGISGELAVARAAGLVASGRASAALAGGVDELSPILYQELTRLRMTSPGPPRGTGGPEEAGREGCWPYDRRANGTILGEGATVLLLEAESLARARGARIYAELRGVAWGNLPAPAHGVPARRHRDPVVIRRALAQADVAPSDVDAVYATGAGEPARDACELDLLGAAFAGQPSRGPWLTALTPLTGEHAGLGTLRVAGAATTLGTGRLPGLPDLATPEREGFAFVPRDGVSLGAAHVLVHGLSPGGGHAAILVSSYPARGR